jgi:hypothetical protein
MKGSISMPYQEEGSDQGGGRLSGNRQWCSIKRRPVTEEVVMGQGTVMGREEDFTLWLGWAAHTEEGGVVAASQEGGGSLAFGRRKGKMERAELGLTTGWAGWPGGPAGPLGSEGEMGWQENKNKRNKWNRTGLRGNLGQNGKWAEENMKEMFLEFLFSSFEFETKVKIQIKYIFKFKQV